MYEPSSSDMHAADISVNPQNELICFEFPLNEKVRTQLRLEFLYRKTLHALECGSAWDHRTALFTILDMLAVLARGDVRAEVTKELERIRDSLLPLRQMAGVDQAQLSDTLNQVDHYLAAIMEERTRTADLKDNDFLNNVKQRAGLPGGACEFDLPALHAWLNQPANYRDDDLRHWLESFEALHGAIGLCMQLLRASADQEKLVVQASNLNHTLTPNRDCQLVQIYLAKNLHCYPVVSGNRFGLSIRLMKQLDLARKDEAVLDDVAITLACSYL